MPQFYAVFTLSLKKKDKNAKEKKGKISKSLMLMQRLRTSFLLLLNL